MLNFVKIFSTMIVSDSPWYSKPRYSSSNIIKCLSEKVIQFLRIDTPWGLSIWLDAKRFLCISNQNRNDLQEHFLNHFPRDFSEPVVEDYYEKHSQEFCDKVDMGGEFNAICYSYK